MTNPSPDLKAMSDDALIALGRWGDGDAEPMNKFAEEYERRHGVLQGEKVE